MEAEEGEMGSGKEAEKCPDDRIKTADENTTLLSSPKTETDASDMDVWYRTVYCVCDNM